MSLKMEMKLIRAKKRDCQVTESATQESRLMLSSSACAQDLGAPLCSGPASALCSGPASALGAA
ncbi:hypothetical protein A2U01_0022969 [Trifolium medium]|uniref:Uncharacterized protein n=1 Tax=Trifolium medium TaxID=97028 RepID=A0A392NS10_9FABA|nr:hypothetical protein [Trifolium medium]